MFQKHFEHLLESFVSRIDENFMWRIQNRVCTFRLRRPSIVDWKALISGSIFMWKVWLHLPPFASFQTLKVFFFTFHISDGKFDLPRFRIVRIQGNLSLDGHSPAIMGNVFDDWKNFLQNSRNISYKVYSNNAHFYLSSFFVHFYTCVIATHFSASIN